MNSKIKIAAIGAGALLILAFLLSWVDTRRELRETKKDLEKQKQNVESLERCQSYYFTGDSIRVAAIQAVQLDRDQQKKLLAEAKKEIEKLKDAKKAAPEYFTKVNIHDTIEIVKWDTVVTRGDTCLGYEDGATKAILCGDSLTFMTRDCVHQVIRKHYKRRFLWWRWGNDGISQEAWNENPHIILTFDTFVKFDQ